MISLELRKLASAALVLGCALVWSVAAEPADGKPSKLSGKEKKEVDSLLKELFLATEQTDRERVLEALRPLDHPSERDIVRLRKKCLAWMRVGPRVESKHEVTCSHPDFPGS